MAFKKPSYADRYNGLAQDPSKMVIQGPVCWALGWPPLDHEVNPHITPTEFQRVRSLIAGKGTGAVSKRTKNKSSLKSINPEDK